MRIKIQPSVSGDGGGKSLPTLAEIGNQALNEQPAFYQGPHGANSNRCLHAVLDCLGVGGCYWGQEEDGKVLKTCWLKSQMVLVVCARRVCLSLIVSGLRVRLASLSPVVSGAHNVRPSS